MGKLLLFLNWLVFTATASEPAGNASTLLFNAGRAASCAWAGWNLVRRGLRPLRAALVGPFFMFLEHVVLSGGMFILSGNRMAAAGVMLSFIMFAWVDAIPAWLGGVAAARYDSAA